MWQSFFEILFWICLVIVFYTYVGYGMLLYLFVRIKEFFHPYCKPEWQEELPEVTLLIAAYNEEKVVEEKMRNCKALNYPPQKLTIAWITDGSNDNTNSLLAQYPEIKLYFHPERKGKTAALNRAVPFVTTPYTILTDANTMLNPEAVREIVNAFADKQTGCVAGEKRIENNTKDNAASGGEGFYWRYESKLKAWDSRLYSTVGAAGELFAIQTTLFEPMPADTLLDDFMISLRIAEKGYKITYCASAYAIEKGSADIRNEQKRKIRIAAGGLQAICRLRSLLNLFKYKTLSFQYISHRVLRWSVTPVALLLLLPLNTGLAICSPSLIYRIILLFQLLFYILASTGAYFQSKQIKIKILFIPYYFLFMNLNVIKAFFYYKKFKGKGTWEKAKRAE
ncbi:glycosyltransferase family 2 protein [uncultured Culturomica sp.]|jgi:cellulose synthase/poly-beta-1,6-N-acetylglucosamine synthase-like glycosyltransferase|uniref:glycosyltransferase family 2 protein n=1 Tax=uncultured Culturomica sp. TaxID=1926654 RepID=UPI00033B5008|nr:glycosyltransferase family 2 protein [uncultured Culturomica sp.]CCZ09287.1 putative uncharacterized protein [Odoribacter sp. CAG:788]